MTSIASSTDNYSHLADAREPRGTAVWKTLFRSEGGKGATEEGVVYDTFELFANENGPDQFRS
jgi:hypothetical protein